MIILPDEDSCDNCCSPHSYPCVIRIGAGSRVKLACEGCATAKCSLKDSDEKILGWEWVEDALQYTRDRLEVLAGEGAEVEALDVVDRQLTELVRFSQVLSLLSSQLILVVPVSPLS